MLLYIPPSTVRLFYSIITTEPSVDPRSCLGGKAVEDGDRFELSFGRIIWSDLIPQEPVSILFGSGLRVQNFATHGTATEVD